MSRNLVVIPTFNEKENLDALVRQLLALPEAPVDVLIVDDSSPDGTGDVADQLARENPRVRVLHRPAKSGLGTAILAGVGDAQAHGYVHVITMDADFSHDPKYVPDLLRGMETHDLMIGSRYVPGGGTVNWSFWRKANSFFANLLTRWILWLPVRDCSAGFKCYRVDLLAKVRQERMLARGYAIQEELLFRYLAYGRRVGEVPILFRNRERGTSKMAPREMVETMSVLLRLRWEGWFGRRANLSSHSPSPSGRGPG